MKKRITLILALVALMLCFMSCTPTSSQTSSAKPTEVQTTEEDFVTEISILKEPTKTVFAYNEEPSFSGLKVLVMYKD